MTPAILHVVTGIDVGGAENHLLTLCEGLTDRGFDVTVAYLKGDGELEAKFREAGCGVVRIGIRADIDPFAFARLAAHVAANDYDVVHTHLFHGDSYGVPAATLARVPAVVSSKHNDPPYWRTQPYRTIHGLTLRGVDRVFPISDHVSQYLLRTTGIPPAKVQTIRYALDPEPFDDTAAGASSRRREFGGGPLVGTVARLTEQKDLGTLLRAFARVRDDHDAHLIVVGRGEERGELEQLATDLGLQDTVTFTGFRDDVPELMHAFDVFALPSRWEGFGVVFMEAMATRTPVVASDVSAIPEVVADGETGYLCPPGDVEAFASRIARLLDDDDLREQMGAVGRRRLETEFSVERMVNEMVDAYRELLTD